VAVSDFEWLRQLGLQRGRDQCLNPPIGRNSPCTCFETVPAPGTPAGARCIDFAPNHPPLEFRDQITGHPLTLRDVGVVDPGSLDADIQIWDLVEGMPVNFVTPVEFLAPTAATESCFALRDVECLEAGDEDRPSVTIFGGLTGGTRLPGNERDFPNVDRVVDGVFHNFDALRERGIAVPEEGGFFGPRAPNCADVARQPFIDPECIREKTSGRTVELEMPAPIPPIFQTTQDFTEAACFDASTGEVDQECMADLGFSPPPIDEFPRDLESLRELERDMDVSGDLVNELPTTFEPPPPVFSQVTPLPDDLVEGLRLTSVGLCDRWPAAQGDCPCLFRLVMR